MSKSRRLVEKLTDDIGWPLETKPIDGEDDIGLPVDDDDAEAAASEVFGERLMAGEFDDHLKLVLQSEDDVMPSREELTAKLDELAAQGFKHVVAQNEYGGYWAIYAWNGTPIPGNPALQSPEVPADQTLYGDEGMTPVSRELVLNYVS